MISIVIMFLSLFGVLYISDYIYFKTIVVESLQPLILRVFALRILIGLTAGVLVGISFQQSLQHHYLTYIVICVYVSFLIYRFNFRRYSYNVIKVFKDYKRLNRYSKMRVIKNMPELSTEEKLKMVSKLYFKRWRVSKDEAEDYINMIFDNGTKPTDVKELIYQLFIYGHLANSSGYRNLSFDSNKNEEDFNKLNQWYTTVMGK